MLASPLHLFGKVVLYNYFNDQLSKSKHEIRIKFLKMQMRNKALLKFIFYETFGNLSGNESMSPFGKWIYVTFREMNLCHRPNFFRKIWTLWYMWGFTCQFLIGQTKVYKLRRWTARHLLPEWETSPAIIWSYPETLKGKVHISYLQYKHINFSKP